MWMSPHAADNNGVVHPVQTAQNVDLPQPDGPINAVTVLFDLERPRPDGMVVAVIDLHALAEILILVMGFGPSIMLPATFKFYAGIWRARS
jgi:hypothetical protein